MYQYCILQLVCTVTDDRFETLHVFYTTQVLLCMSAILLDLTNTILALAHRWRASLLLIGALTGPQASAAVGAPSYSTPLISSFRLGPSWVLE